MSAETFKTESQKQRWLKYGLNVALSAIVVIALSVLVVYLAEKPKFDRRIDTTSAGSYSLKPQTINLLGGLKQKVQLVSLYAAKDSQDQDNPKAGQIRDLLDEYASHSSNVEVDSIDPIKQPTKTDALITDVMQRYGGAIASYRDFTKNFQEKSSGELKEMLDAESTALKDVSVSSSSRDAVSQNAAQVVTTISDQLPQLLTKTKTAVDRALKDKYPDYRAIADRLKDALGNISDVEKEIVDYAEKNKDAKDLPDSFRAYLGSSIERHKAIQKRVDDENAKIATLGELKVADLQQAIRGQDLVLVLGEKEWRVVNEDQIWVNDSRDLRTYTEGEKLKPRFAGEQALTSAILAVSTSLKSKVAFVRAGGPPLTTPGFPPFQPDGPLSAVADRLRAYNFDVVEKDLTGQYAMQAQMQGGQAEPEPTDADLKNAIWIVVDMEQQQQQQQMGGPPPSIDAKVAAHLKEGGSAVILASPQSDALPLSTKDFGIELSTDAVIVHEVPKTPHQQSSDIAQEAQWLPFIFVMNDYGDQTLTSPLRSLDSILIGAVPVQTKSTEGVKCQPILPIPQVNPVWGEKNLESADGTDLSFDKATDIAGPLAAGAVAEKGESRLVVLGNLRSFQTEIVRLRDEDLKKRGVSASRFPGDAELFANAVFWAAKMDTMIAISPQAMEVSRIAPMSDAALGFWRVGVLLIALPGLVIAAGLYVFFSRRD